MTIHRKITRLTLALALGLFGMQIGFAQGPPQGDHGKRGEHRLEKMTTELGLSETQVAQVRAINEKYHPEMKALRMEAKGGEGDRSQMKALHNKIKAEMKTVLTPEQQRKMEEMHGKRGHHGKMGHHKGRGHGPKNPEARAYVKENVMPVVLEQRAKLETKLSTTDKAELASIRAEMKAVRPLKKEVRQDMKASRKAGEQPTEAQRAEMKATREQHHAIMNKASVIADKYASDIAALQAEIQPQAETWKADLRAMHEKARTEGEARPEGSKAACEKGDKAACEAKCAKGKKGKKGKKGRHHGPEGRLMHKMDATHFILMDPNGKMGQDEEVGLVPEAPALEIYPNPATARNSIRYEVARAGNVQIQLVTKDGRVVRELLNAHHDAGNYSLDVETGSLKTDVYYYRITDADGPRVKRFTIVK